jgi:hypothetical protein
MIEASMRDYRLAMTASRKPTAAAMASEVAGFSRTVA